MARAVTLDDDLRPPDIPLLRMPDVPPEFHFATGGIRVVREQSLYGIYPLIQVIGYLARHLIIRRLDPQIHTKRALGIILKYIPLVDEYSLKLLICFPNMVTYQRTCA